MRTIYTDKMPDIFEDAILKKDGVISELEDVLSWKLLASFSRTEYELSVLEIKFCAAFRPDEEIEENCIYPLVMSRSKMSSTHFTRRSGLEMYQLVYTEDGAGMLKTEGGTYRLTKGRFFLIDCRKEHYFYADSPNGWEYSMIHFDGKDVPFLFGKAVQKGACFDDAACPEAKASLRRLFSLAAEYPENFDLKAHALLTELLTALAGSNPQEKAGVPAWLSDVLAYIVENYNRKLNLETLARMCYLSESRFSHKFRQEMGVSPIEYQYRLRISRAAELLKATDSTVKEVSLAVGFQDEAYFHTRFRNMYGKTPTQYRKSMDNSSI